MNSKLDERIARVTAELQSLRRRKLHMLRRSAAQTEKQGGRPLPRRRRLSGGKVRRLLTKAVAEAGHGGISAMKAAERASIPYGRVRLLMPRLFKKRGSGRGTAYVLKPEEGQ